VADSSPPDNAVLGQKLISMFLGNFITQLVYVAAKLGLPDLLSSGPMTLDRLAASSDAHPRTLHDILRALVAMEILAEHDGQYSLLPLGVMLKSAPGWRSQAILIGEEYFRASADLLHSVRSGQPAFDHVFGANFYEYFQRNAEAGARFNEVMTLSALGRYADVPERFDFSRVRTIVDVGAGHGGLTSIVLTACPEMRAIVFDSAQVIEGARINLESQGIAARCSFVVGNFFESVPPGGDLYLLSSVIVNWDDDRARTILANCRSAAADLVLIDYGILPGSNYPPGVLISAIAAFAIQGSRMRSESEYSDLLARSGFKLERIAPLNREPYVLIHAKPI
jgi:hypothetical protein